MLGADAEQATKQRDKSKVEFGITRLICVRQKEIEGDTNFKRSFSVCAQQTLLRELWDTNVKALLCGVRTWPLLG